ncbi:hypothetical protein [Frigoribacterium sp. CG_9.8]|nr:hypothetical protein [Frigoribacterium sp. CG_9.8]MBG6108413.1 hypothetical protein [Frigoribacterium sp. CG_9.8]
MTDHILAQKYLALALALALAPFKRTYIETCGAKFEGLTLSPAAP